MLPQFVSFVVQRLSSGQAWYSNTNEWSFEQKVALLTGCQANEQTCSQEVTQTLTTQSALINQLNEMLLTSVKNRNGDVRAYNTLRLDLIDPEAKLQHWMFSIVEVVGPLNRFLLNNLILSTSISAPSCSESLTTLSLNLNLWSLPSQRPTSVFNPELRASKFWDDENLPITTQIIPALENLFHDVKTEMHTFLKQGNKLKDEGEGIIANPDVGKWKEIPLLKHGEPKTTSFPKTLTHLLALEPVFNAKISFMYPGTFVEQHTGPSNERLRCHLCLDEGLGSAVLDVAGEKRKWEEGKAFIFDDSFVHLVAYPVEICEDEDDNNEYNDDDEMKNVRIVLIVDVWHPDVKERKFI
ncbi:hypothetical protein TL16_g01583 [Triparma laevis f. inornata]|uniref:Aspartyl/asparaginy/proline hydroxylase domain-containing protein n=2 Tax=Triparma laevis TaxID=1534972 RepID=A0A9W7F110_9STRA|nr:hypothetical protein TL16_g01583 [Triparma laevis f. inornata]GMH99123.1 hypothetical protein TrLO_g6884 [Triparma laevis f. longispina]